MAFGRKKIERPKNILGLALYRYDGIINTDLKKIIKALKLKKNINPRRAGVNVEKAFSSLDRILDDISKDNFKTDYRSDKIRYNIISLIDRLKKVFQRAKEISFNAQKSEENKLPERLDEIIELRESLKPKLQDIESDYI
jgi:hypothetical protein